MSTSRNEIIALLKRALKEDENTWVVVRHDGTRYNDGTSVKIADLLRIVEEVDEAKAWRRGKTEALRAARIWAAERRGDELRGGALQSDGSVIRLFKEGICGFYAEGVENAVCIVERDLQYVKGET